MCGGQTATGEEEVSEVKHEPRGPLHAVCREPTGVKRPHSGSFQARGPGGGTRRRPFSSIDSSLEEETHKVATKEHSRRTGEAMPSWDQSVPNAQDQATESARKARSDELINNRTLRCLQIQGSPKVSWGFTKSSHNVMPRKGSR